MEKHESCLPEIELMVGCQQFIILKIGILGRPNNKISHPFHIVNDHINMVIVILISNLNVMPNLPSIFTMIERIIDTVRNNTRSSRMKMRPCPH